MAAGDAPLASGCPGTGCSSTEYIAFIDPTLAAAATSVPQPHDGARDVEVCRRGSLASDRGDGDDDGAQLRTAALGLVHAEETTDDEGRPTFAVDGRVFAVLDGSRVRLHLSAPDVAAITAAHPTAEPAPDGATLALDEIDGQQLNHWVRRAWAARAPQELAETAAAAATARPGEVGDLPRAIGRPATVRWPTPASPPSRGSPPCRGRSCSACTVSGPRPSGCWTRRSAAVNPRDAPPPHPPGATTVRVSTLTRYPVKSMLGQPLEEALLATAGLPLDRRYGLLDATTGLVATAKHPRLWRRLLQYTASCTQCSSFYNPASIVNVSCNHEYCTIIFFSSIVLIYCASYIVYNFYCMHFVVY